MSYGCRCMRTWRLCFRKWIDPPNVLDGWIVPLTQAHVEQYMHDKNGHSYELIYCSKQIVQDAAYYFREGVVYADMDTIDKFVYEQYTPGREKYAVGCYGDCTWLRFDVYYELRQAIKHDGVMAFTPVDIYSYSNTNETYLMFSEWRKQWLTRVYFLLHLRKVGAELWSWLPRDLLRWFIMQYVGADVWACFGCRRGDATYTYRFALFPADVQPSGHMGGQTARVYGGFCGIQYLVILQLCGTG